MRLEHFSNCWRQLGYRNLEFSHKYSITKHTKESIIMLSKEFISEAHLTDPLSQPNPGHKKARKKVKSPVAEDVGAAMLIGGAIGGILSYLAAKYGQKKGKELAGKIEANKYDANKIHQLYSNPEFVKQQGLAYFKAFNVWFKSIAGYDWPVNKDIPDDLLDEFGDFRNLGDYNKVKVKQILSKL